MSFVDLHCHSDFSPDGRGTVEALLGLATRRGTRLLAFTDHNHPGRGLALRQQAARRGITLLSGAELDLVDPATGAVYHFLALGFDPEHASLSAFLREQASVYERNFFHLLPHFARCGFTFDPEACRLALAERYPGNPSPALNRWHLEDWLIETQGIRRQAFREAVRAILTESPGPRFAPCSPAFELVHDAGGIILLAHVARYFPGNAAAQIGLIHDLLARGMDGFELLHPSNLGDPSFPALEAEARRLSCLVSGGSDAHDALGLVGEADPLFGRMEAQEWMLERFRTRFDLTL